MGKVDLNGKNVMIATTNWHGALKIMADLKERGANVVICDHSPEGGDDRIVDDIEKRVPKVDALIIHNPASDKVAPLYTAVRLAKRLAEHVTVVVCDCSDYKAHEIKLNGATFLLWDDWIHHDYSRLATIIAESMTKLSRPGKELSH